MPSSPSTGPRLAAVMLLVGIAGIAAWIAWPRGEPMAVPAEATATSALPAGPEAAAAVTSPVAAAERTAAAAPTKSAAATSEPAAPSVRGAAAAILRGRVVDAHSAPIAGARVALVSREEVPPMIALPTELLEKRSDAATTDANGKFVVPLPEPGPFELVASHDDRPDARTSGTATTPVVDDLVIVMEEGGTIRGMVVGAPADATDLQVLAKPVATLLDQAKHEASSLLIDIGDFVENIDVTRDARRAKPEPDGTFTIRGLDVTKSYRVFGVRQTDGAMPARCTERVEVRTGAAGVALRWRETLDLVVRVVDADTGAPLETLDVAVGPVHEMKVMGMRVPVPMRQPTGQRQFAGGVVRIAGLGVDDGESKRMSIEVRASGHRTWSRDDIDVATRGVVDLGIARLVAAPIVRVTVTDAHGPVAGAAVRVVAASEEEGPQRNLSFSSTVATNDTANAAGPTIDTEGGPHDVTTDAAGIAEVTADFVGRARIEVESTTHAQFRGAPFALPDRGTLEQSAQLVRGGTVNVQARDGHGEPLANATVRRRSAGDDGDSATLRTDAAGRATFERVPPGPWRFDLPEPGEDSPIRVGLSLGRAAKPDPRSSSVVVVDATTVSIDLTAPLRGTLRGVVTFAGQPLDRAEVRIGDPTNDDDHDEMDRFVESMLGGLGGKTPDKVRTDVDGTFAFENVAVGDRRLVVTHRDLAMPTAVDVHLVEGDNVKDVAVHGATLRGRVVGADGKPLEGASVAVSVDSPDAAATAADLEEAANVMGELFGGSQRSRIRTDAEGRFELRGVRPDRPLRISAEARMHVAASTTTPAITDGSARDGIEVRLAAAGRIRVKSNGANAVAVEAEWAGETPVPPGMPAKRTTLLKNGRATLDGVPPGRWRLHLEGPETPGEVTKTVTVVAGGTVDAEF